MDIAFTPAVKAMQDRLGSRAMMQTLETRRGFGRRIDGDLRAFLETRDSLYLATASAEGRPYLQHRGGDAGFLRVVDEHRFALAEEHGNRQYVTFGNLSENDRVALFMIDYPSRQRIKIWGTGRLIERDRRESGDDAVWPMLPDDAERALVITVEAWDVNCPKFITPRYTEPQVAAATEGLRRAIAERDARITELEAEVAALREAATGA